MKKRYWLGAVLLLGVSAGILLGPRLLLRAATEKPANTGTFVTHPVPAPDLRQQLQLAVQQSSTAANFSALPPADRSNKRSPAPERFTDLHPTRQVNAQGTREDSPPVAEVNSGAISQPSAAPDTQPLATQHIETPKNYSEKAVPPTSRQFQLQLSEQELASMIYNGLYAGTAPEYRPSLQGVSVQLQGGRGKITVALWPKYLPAHFLRNLPGVTPETPTIYVGGEVGLNLSDNMLIPEIYSLSLGNLRIPAPFIKAMVKYQVQQQVKQMTQLAPGQRAILDAVEVDQGKVMIQGHVQAD